MEYVIWQGVPDRWTRIGIRAVTFSFMSHKQSLMKKSQHHCYCFVSDHDTRIDLTRVSHDDLCFVWEAKMKES